MSVQDETASIAYPGNDSANVFAVPFYFLADEHLKLVVTETGQIPVTLVLDTDYTVTGAGVPAGGSVDLSIWSLEPMATGKTLTITRNLPLEQLTVYPATGPFPAASHERALDYLTMLVQQLKSNVDSIVADELVGYPANLVSAFGAALIANTTAAGARAILALGNLATPTASAFFLTLVDDVSAAEMRETLGIATVDDAVFTTVTVSDGFGGALEKFSSTEPEGADGGNVFIGGGGDSVVWSGAPAETYQGSSNSAFGSGSGTGLTLGYKNSFFGKGSGSGVTTGSKNTIVGPYLGSATLTSNIVLADGVGAAKAQFDGTNWTLQGKLGVGGTSPTARLHLPAGSATASTAPLKFTAGPLLTAVEEGAMEFKGHTLYFTTFQVRRSVVLAQEVPIADVMVNNTATETVVYSVPMAANYLTAGKHIDVELMGIFSSIAGGTGVLTFKINYAGATIATLATAAAANTNSPFKLSINTTCRAIGSGTTGKLISFIDFAEAATASVMVAGALTDVDTTVLNTLEITAQWASANVGNLLSLQQGHTLCIDANT